MLRQIKHKANFKPKTTEKIFSMIQFLLPLQKVCRIKLEDLKTQDWKNETLLKSRFTHHCDIDRQRVKPYSIQHTL